MWVQGVLEALIARSDDAPGLVRILTHEAADPSPILRELVQAIIKPIRDDLRRIIRGLTKGALHEAAISTVVNSVSGMCLVYTHERHVLQELGEPTPHTRALLPGYVDAITRFSLAGIRDLVASSESQPTRSVDARSSSPRPVHTKKSGARLATATSAKKKRENS
ncbi:MAG: CerR family C-terminal domain-containing protein [Opitutaceae bacterium]|nr:CerR family C-terminal domain-containing protein [Opitutaceae bacterium]